MRKKRENGMAKESGMGDFPRKQFESVLLHPLRIMDQNREYLQTKGPGRRWRIWGRRASAWSAPCGR